MRRPSADLGKRASTAATRGHAASRGRAGEARN